MKNLKSFKSFKFDVNVLINKRLIILENNKMHYFNSVNILFMHGII
jgi:hypothetical protein